MSVACCIRLTTPSPRMQLATGVLILICPRVLASLPYSRRVWQVAGEVIPHTVLLREGNTPALSLLWPYISAHMDFGVMAAGIEGDGLVSAHGCDVAVVGWRLSWKGIAMPIDLCRIHVHLHLPPSLHRPPRLALLLRVLQLHWGPYGDWLATQPTSTLFAENWYYQYAALLASDMASAIGRPQEAAAYTVLAATIASSMVDKLFNFSSGTWDTSSDGTNQNAQAMALVAGLGGNRTSKYAPSIISALAADVTAHGSHPTGGVASIRWILDGMVAGNRSDLALSMAGVEGSPGWAYESTPDMPGE